MKNEIDIWKLLDKFPQSDINHPNHNNGDGDTVMGLEEVRDAMFEFGKQLLELAVENVMKVEFIETGPMDESVLESITNTINQVK